MYRNISYFNYIIESKKINQFIYDKIACEDKRYIIQFSSDE